MAGEVVMYTLATCPTCVQARQVLKQRGIDFEDRVVDDRIDWQMDVVRLSNQSTVPVIVWADGRVEVGIDGECG
jgi:glutaredoxin 3